MFVILRPKKWLCIEKVEKEEEVRTSFFMVCVQFTYLKLALLSVWFFSGYWKNVFLKKRKESKSFHCSLAKKLVLERLNNTEVHWQTKEVSIRV